MGRKQDIQTKIFDIADNRDLTVEEVKEAIIGESNLALCEMISEENVTIWRLTEVDVFFPDDDYVTVTKEVAEQIINQDDVCQQTLEEIKIYRRC